LSYICAKTYLDDVIARGLKCGGVSAQTNVAEHRSLALLLRTRISLQER
jgi:hypothetical protein